MKLKTKLRKFSRVWNLYTKTEANKKCRNSNNVNIFRRHFLFYFFYFFIEVLKLKKRAGPRHPATRTQTWCLHDFKQRVQEAHVLAAAFRAVRFLTIVLGISPISPPPRDEVTPVLQQFLLITRRCRGSWQNALFHPELFISCSGWCSGLLAKWMTELNSWNRLRV